MTQLSAQIKIGLAAFLAGMNRSEDQRTWAPRLMALPFHPLGCSLAPEFLFPRETVQLMHVVHKNWAVASLAAICRMYVTGDVTKLRIIELHSRSGNAARMQIYCEVCIGSAAFITGHYNLGTL